MAIATGTYVGNSKRQFISVPWLDPVQDPFIIVKSDSTDQMVCRIPVPWMDRTEGMGSLQSGANRVRPVVGGFWVGLDLTVNGLGVTYHWAILAKSASLNQTYASWMGNGLAGHVVPLEDESLAIQAALIKRDTAISAVFMLNGQNNVDTMTGAVTANGITSLGTGQFTVGTSIQVNELTPATQLGEAINGIYWGASSAMASGSIVGNGATNRAVDIGGQPRVLFLIQEGNTANRPMRVITNTTSGKTMSVSALALQTGEVSLTATGFTLGNTNLNETSKTLHYLAFFDHADLPAAVSAPSLSGRKVVSLAGRRLASVIDCGQDNSLKFGGAITLEWYGSVAYTDSAKTACAALMIRGGGVGVAGVGNVPNSQNWGMLINAPDCYGEGWSGPQIGGIVTDRYLLPNDTTGPSTGDIRSTWRCGNTVPFNKPVHYVMTHNGTGLWSLYQNGKLIRHRQIDMSTVGIAVGNLPPAGLTSRSTYIGAINDNGVVSFSQQMLFAFARVYNVELTRQEVRDRFSRGVMGSATADVTRGLVEEWNASNASGVSLPATINSANNGTIKGGVVITAP